MRIFWVTSEYHVTVSVGDPSHPNVFWTVEIYFLSLPHPTTLFFFSLSKILTVQKYFGRLTSPI